MHTEHLFRVHLYYWWALDFSVYAHVLPIGIALDEIAVVAHLCGERMPSASWCV